MHPIRLFHATSDRNLIKYDKNIKSKEVKRTRRIHIMKEKIMDERIHFLFKAILSLRSEEECYNFFEDLCTVAELQEMSKRLQAAKMLNDNFIYTEIAERTGLSTATISRVNRCLKYGNDGYITALERLEHEK